MAKKVSIKEIANKVGVSTALVSYVLNGLEKEKRVGPEIVIKIRQVAKELNYKPNQIARSLRRGSTSTIGLIVGDIANPFFGKLARVIEDEAAKFNYTVVFGSSDEDSKKSEILMNILRDRQVDGLIITPSEECLEPIKVLEREDMPIVLIDRYFYGISTNYVVLDNHAATYSAVNCFISKGYNKIVIIVYKSSLVHMKERIQGYQDAMKDNGFENDIMVKEVRYNYVESDIEKIIDKLFEEKKYNALLFATNTLSISGLYSIRKHNIKVPDDMAIIGFDGHEVFDFFQPPLTYIKQPVEEMGKESVKILIEQINGSRKTVHVKLKHQLIERTSSG